MRLQLISELVHADKINYGSYLDPDSFYSNSGGIAFVYNSNGTLHHSTDQKTRHVDLIAQHATYYMPDLTDTNFRDFDEVKQAADFSPRFAAVKTSILYDLVPSSRKHSDLDALLGRIGYDGMFVAFWNDTTKPKLVVPCLRSLINNKLITPDTVYVLGRQRVKVSDILGGVRVYMSPEDQEKREKMRELHLMSPQQKKVAMKELGLAGGGHKQPWQKAAENNKLVQPGQKWWAATSESK